MAYRALIIDDNAVNTAVISGLLEKFDVESVLVADGEEAVARDDLNEFQIVFTDYLMPGMNGIEVGKRIKEIVALKGGDVPVIMCTANPDAAGQAADYEQGIRYILKKPVKIQELEQVLRRYVDRDIKMLAHTEEKKPEEFKIPGLDTAYAIKQSGDIHIYESILREYYSAIDKTSQRIRQFQNDNDADKFRIEVHGLKSSSNLVGAMEIARMCEYLENAVRSRQPKDFHTQTEYLLKLYGECKVVIAPFVPESLKDHAGKKTTTKEYVSERLQSIYKLLDDFEMDAAEEVVEELNRYSLDDPYEEMLSSLEKALADIDYEAGMEIITLYLENHEN